MAVLSVVADAPRDDVANEVRELLMFDGDQLVTDLRVLAKTFGKRHKNVLQAYDKLRCSKVFRRLNFQPSEYLNEQGKTSAAWR